MTTRPGTARASLHGGCRLCGTRDAYGLNDDGWCRPCWLRLNDWAVPALPPPRVMVATDQAGYGAPRGGSFDSEIGRFPYLLHNPERSRPTQATIRPWQRRPWQETPIGHRFHDRRPGFENVPSWARGSLRPHRDGFSRIDALNSDPLHSDAPRAPGTGGVHYDTGFVLRCLVCLGPPEAYRPRHDEDQSCKACDLAWRRAGRPEWLDYDAFVQARRVNYLQKHAPAAQLFALTRLNPKSPSDQANIENTPRSTRVNYIDVVPRGYNRGIEEITERRLALGLSVPYGWRRDHDDPGLLVPELTLEKWRADRRRKSGLELMPVVAPDQLATITDISARFFTA